MANEVNQEKNSPEPQSGDQSSPEVEELGQSAASEAGVVEPENLVAEAEAEELRQSVVGETGVAEPGSPVAETEVEELGPGAVPENGVAELKSLVAQKNEELARANTRLIEFEQVVAGKDSQIATLKQAKDELEERLTTASHSLTEAVASYKEMVVRANPEIIEELISGDTIESISESLNEAKTLVSKVRQGLETEISLARVPAGAPERTSPDLSVLSPREKIQYAIGKMR